MGSGGESRGLQRLGGVCLGWEGIRCWHELLGSVGGRTDPGGQEKSFGGDIKFKSLWSDKAKMSREHSHVRGCAAGEEVEVKGEGMGITRQWGWVPARRGFVRGSDSPSSACVRITWKMVKSWATGSHLQRFLVQ